MGRHAFSKRMPIPAIAGRTITACAIALAVTACAPAGPTSAPLDRGAFVLRIQGQGYTEQQSNCIANRVISMYGDQMYGDGQIATSNPEVVERYVRAYSDSC